MQYHKLKIDSPFSFEAGGLLPGLEIVYHTSPREYREGDRVVWICHALTADSDAEDWWPGLVGAGKFFDTERDFIVCVNIIGSPYGTSGPATVNPATGKPYLLDFPKVTVRDIVQSLILVRKALGIKHIDLLTGGSTGGFQVLEWCVAEPDVIRKAAILATDARCTPYLSAFDETMKMALEADPSFRKAESLKGGEAGLRCARAIALISYRSYDGYCLTQQEPCADTLFPERAPSYQQYQGEKLVKRFDAYSYYYLVNTCESNNLGRGRGGVEAALSTIKAKCQVICIDSDCLFPPKTMKKIAQAIPGAEYFEIQSAFGHDGFLLENEQLSAIIKNI